MGHAMLWPRKRPPLPAPYRSPGEVHEQSGSVQLERALQSFQLHVPSQARKTEVRPTLASRRQWLGPLTTDGQPCGELLTHQPLLDPLRRPTPRPTTHSHHTKQAAVARATAGKVLASRCARQGQSTRRGMISPPMKCSTSTTWYLYRAAGSSSSSSCVRGYQPRPSRPGSP